MPARIARASLHFAPTARNFTFAEGENFTLFASREQNFTASRGKRGAQYSADPTVRGYGMTSRMFETPVRYMMIRSNPSPYPA